jgi:hypothetical protein
VETNYIIILQNYKARGFLVSSPERLDNVIITVLTLPVICMYAIALNKPHTGPADMYIPPRVGLTTDRVWIGYWIYLQLTGRNTVTDFHTLQITTC